MELCQNNCTISEEDNSQIDFEHNVSQNEFFLGESVQSTFASISFTITCHIHISPCNT